MTHLGLLIWLVATPVHDAPTDPLTSVRDPCAAARELVAQPPCLSAEECGALRSWKRLFGAPRTQELDPQQATASDRELATSHLCLARGETGSRARR